MVKNVYCDASFSKSTSGLGELLETGGIRKTDRKREARKTQSICSKSDHLGRFLLQYFWGVECFVTLVLSKVSHTS